MIQVSGVIACRDIEEKKNGRAKSQCKKSIQVFMLVISLGLVKYSKSRSCFEECMMLTECSQSVTAVTVTNPLLHTASNMTQFYKYGIDIKTNDTAFSLNHSLVWRRYSEFCWLRKNIKSNHYNATVPNLPPQGIFEDRCHPSFIEKRRNGLESFIKVILSNPIYKSQKVLHLFLQTSLTIQEISQNLLGIRNDEVDVTKHDLPRPSIYEYNEIERSQIAVTTDQQDENNSDEQDNNSNVKKPKTSLLKTHKLRSEAKQIKKVTFSEQVRIFMLENASPNTMVMN